MTLRREVIVDRGVNWSKVLQSPQALELLRLVLSSSNRHVRVLNALVEPAAHFPIVCTAQVLEGYTIEPKPAGSDDRWSAKTFLGRLKEFWRWIPIRGLGDDALQHFILMIDGSPRVVFLTIDLHDDFIQMQLPVMPGPHPLLTLATDLGRKHGTKPVPPVTYGFVGIFDPALIQKILRVPKL